MSVELLVEEITPDQLVDGKYYKIVYHYYIFDDVYTEEYFGKHTSIMKWMKKYYFVIKFGNKYVHRHFKKTDKYYKLVGKERAQAAMEKRALDMILERLVGKYFVW